MSSIDNAARGLANQAIVGLATKRSTSVKILPADLDPITLTAFSSGGTVPPIGTVLPQMTTFLTLGKNLFNINTITPGYYVNQTNGVPAASASYNLSDWIAVTPNTQYYCSGNNVNRIAFYTSAQVFISGTLSPANPFTTPSNCTFIRFSYAVAVVGSSLQLEAGTTGTSYVPWGWSLNSSMLTSTAIPASNINAITIGKNLYNYATDTLGYSVYQVNGTIFANASYRASAFIPITPNTVYTQSNSLWYAWYDASQTFISGSDATNIPTLSPRTITSPSNAAYIRVTTRIISTTQPFATQYYGNYQLELGSIATTYEAYHQQFTNSIPYSRGNFSLLLPPEINVAVGTTVEIYNKNICWCGNINNFHFKYTCTKGKQLARKWSYTGVIGDVGAYTLTVDVFDNDLNFVTEGSTTLNVVNVSTAISSTLNILCIGDSLSNDVAGSKPWYEQWQSYANAMFGTGKILFIGTQGTSPYNHEGYSGATSSQMISSQVGTSPFPVLTNQLYNTGTSQIDFTNYLSTHSLPTPNFVQIYLGTNDYGVMTTAQSMANFKVIIDKIIAQLPNAKIFLVLPEFWGDQNSLGTAYGTTYMDLMQRQTVFNFISTLITTYKGYNSHISFVPIAHTLDPDWSFNAVTQPVNPWSPITETIQTGDVHPIDATSTSPAYGHSGYYQEASTFFSHFVKHYLDV